MRPGALLCDGGYRVVAELGRGGVGAVLRAEETSTGRHVAVKVLLDDVDPEHLERFRREGEIAASLSHPGIVRLYASTVGDGGRPLLVYELVEGAETLEARLPALDRDARLRALLEVARALAHAHARGVVHRDVKPANVLVDPAGRARLTDFGLASARGLDRLTRSGAMLGTPYYMSPEQLGLGDGRAGPASDVWALGVILFEALTGERPFDGATILELTARVARGPRSPRRVDRGVSPALEEVCQRALAARPEDRHPDAGAFAQDLERALSAPARPGRLPLALAAGAALLTLGLGLAWAAPGATPPPTPAPRQAPSSSAAPTPEPVWRVAPGDRWRMEMRWSQRKVSPEGHERRRSPGGLVSGNEVLGIERGVARLRCRLLRFQIELVGDGLPLSFDSELAPEGDPIRRVVPIGGEFHMRLDLATGGVVSVDGLEAMLSSRRDRVPPELFAQVEEMLFRFQDALFREHLDGLLRVPPAGQEAALTFQDHLVRDLAVRSTVRRGGAPTRSDELLAWKATVHQQGTTVISFERRGHITYAGGRFREGVVSLRARMREDERQEHWIYEWQVSGRLLPP